MANGMVIIGVMGKGERSDLIILLLVSFLLSLYLFFYTYVVSFDGAFQFIPMAKRFASESFNRAIAYGGQQPLYSFFIAAVSKWVPNFEAAGKAVSTLFGLLIIFPVYFLGKRIFDRKTAFISTLFLALHPYLRRFSADVLKESTYLFFFATAIWFSWRTIEGQKRYPYLFIPLFSVLAYLVRPDGIEVLLVVFFYLLFIKRVMPPQKRWILILLIILSAGILFAPYLLHLRESAGEWALGKTKTLRMILGGGLIHGDVPFLQKILYSLKELNLKIIGTYHPLYLFLLVLGLWKRGGSKLKDGEKFLISLGVCHYLVLFLLVLNLTPWRQDETLVGAYFSGRHVLPLLIVSIFWVGEGFFWISSWISGKVGASRLLSRLDPGRRSLLVLSMSLVLVLALVLPKTLKPQRYERLTEKWAGTWIKDRSGEKSPVFTTLPRVAYYAERDYEYVDLGKTGIAEIKGLMKEKGALYLVIQEKDVPFISTQARGMVEVKRLSGKGLERIIIYQRIQQSDGQGASSAGK
jgi:asparagine N-glycosylation enzyme membrane subunit Stt3